MNHALPNVNPEHGEPGHQALNALANAVVGQSILASGVCPDSGHRLFGRLWLVKVYRELDAEGSRHAVERAEARFNSTGLEPANN